MEYVQNELDDLLFLCSLILGITKYGNSENKFCVGF